VDFLGAAEQARQTINAWVAKATNNLIAELIPDGAITSDTRLVITNAIYFFAGWNTPFSKELTADAPFTALSGEKQTVQMMTLQGDLSYGEHLGAQIVELPYVGEEVSMVVVLPETGQFAAFEQALDSAALDAIVGSLQMGEGTLRMPKLELKARFSLKQALNDLGMPTAFQGGVADFSKITQADAVYIHDVLHEGVVKIDEEGTEAAAATAVIIGVESAPAVTFNMTIDRPYLFFIRDKITGAILFVGRVVHFSNK
jgi:serpin B